MAANTHIYTSTRVATLLGITEDLLDALACTLEPEDGVLRILDNTEEFAWGFTDFGIEGLRELLGDPMVMNDILQDLPQEQI